MANTDFIAAKKIVEFYSEKLSESNTVESQFALQYAALKQLKFRTNCLLDGLEAYAVEVE